MNGQKVDAHEEKQPDAQSLATTDSLIIGLAWCSVGAHLPFLLLYLYTLRNWDFAWLPYWCFWALILAIYALKPSLPKNGRNRLLAASAVILFLTFMGMMAENILFGAA